MTNSRLIFALIGSLCLTAIVSAQTNLITNGGFEQNSVSIVQTGTFVPEDNSPKTAIVDISKKYQTIQGFGAAVAYYADWLANHPYKNEIYKLLYTDAGLELLRMGNWYNQPNFTTANEAAIITQASALLGHPVKVLVSSWSPPANLKSNGSVNGGTLSKTGLRMVGSFGKYRAPEMI